MSGPKFTEAMKRDYTILIPDMTTIHFKFLARIFESCGYRVDILYNQGPNVVDEGLKYVHNDTCYPALLCIGQMMDALHSGKYDVHKTALMLTQTGGGCRASNYIALLRKALDKAGLEFVPVLSLNFSGLDDNAIKLTPAMMVKALMAVVYGDLLMLLRNQTIPYEDNKGRPADRGMDGTAARGVPLSQADLPPDPAQKPGRDRGFLRRHSHHRHAQGQGGHCRGDLREIRGFGQQ